MPTPKKRRTAVLRFDRSREVRLTINDLSRLIKTPIPAIRSLVKKGMPHRPQVGSNDLYFNLHETIAWWAKYNAAKADNYRKGREVVQGVLRDAVDGEYVLRELQGIDLEFRELTEDLDIALRDMELLIQRRQKPRQQDTPESLDYDDIVIRERREHIRTKANLLVQRRSGLESVLKKVLPDLKTLEIESDKDKGSPAEQALAMFADAAKKA